MASAVLLAACVPDPNIYGPYPPGQRPGMYGKPPVQPPRPPAAEAPSAQFFGALSRYCGLAFEGQVVTRDPEDAAMRRERLVLDVRDCNPREIRMPFIQGANRSRTWVLSRRGPGLALKHDHRLRSGRPEPITLYGGSTVGPGTAFRQEFPADNYSAELFFRANRPDSAKNIWAMEVVPGRLIAYELRRPGRFLRVEFDVRRPIGPQPAAWGQR
jgi:hypothetical protein